MVQVGQLQWSATAKGIIDALKSDLGLDNNLPVVVGELRQDASSCCSGMNSQINAFAQEYQNCGLASSAGLSVQTDDPYHFSAAGMRELGKRYAQAFLSHASNDYIPRRGTVNTINSRNLMSNNLKSTTIGITVYSLDGRVIRPYSTKNVGNVFGNLNAGRVYIISRKFNDGSTAIDPIIKD